MFDQRTKENDTIWSRDLENEIRVRHLAKRWSHIRLEKIILRSSKERALFEIQPNGHFLLNFEALILSAESKTKPLVPN